MSSGKVEVALAIGERYGVTTRQKVVEEKVIRTARMCAKYGLPYVAVYRELANGHFRLKGCEKVLPGRANNVGGITKTIDVKLIDGGWLRDEECPYCGAVNYVVCCVCKASVCRGGVKGESFRCYDACGARLTLGEPCTSMVGSVEGPSLEASNTKAAAKALPGSGGGLLGSGKR